MFRRVELAALRRWNDLGELHVGSGWDAERWPSAIKDYFEEYDSIRPRPDARGPALLQVTREPGRWLVRQVSVDPEGDHDWAIPAVVDLPGSDEAGEAAVTIKDFARQPLCRHRLWGPSRQSDLLGPASAASVTSNPSGG
ncbi:DUF3516 domain-containing protein [Knoellia sp. 3-2P3]|uniref:DUF3516 domain-containing protein n=1 Tax=Knoellia sp. 3-2P3 TaxID=3032285 RepID=UPI0023DBF5D2|nr:DUF3516 domain-containing protein [Knoellia sp. 3-2P3]MDF2093108.1 DUF3516 domain-containing protein [Knoellia sp. 3-2P3]